LLYLVQNNGNSVYLYLDDGAPGSSEMWVEVCIT
jgi:hypothetical protein